jgi:DivIVA domain-containing protein
MDRRSIERRDFPTGRRGYDPAAVDAHLRAIADQVEELEAAARRRTETLAEAASEQVRLIVEAAESSAAEIKRRAEREAAEQLARLSEAAAAMLERLEVIDRELASLLESLRAGGRRLVAELKLLEESLTPLREAVSPAAGSAPAVAEGLRSERPAPTKTVEGDAGRDAELEGDAGPEAEGARLIALNMALSGSPREEVDRYLAENFKLADRQRLLDEVYASAVGE